MSWAELYRAWWLLFFSVECFAIISMGTVISMFSLTSGIAVRFMQVDDHHAASGCLEEALILWPLQLLLRSTRLQSPTNSRKQFWWQVNDEPPTLICSVHAFDDPNFTVAHDLSSRRV